MQGCQHIFFTFVHFCYFIFNVSNVIIFKMTQRNIMLDDVIGDCMALTQASGKRCRLLPSDSLNGLGR